MEFTFDAPGPGPWQQDQAHVPHGWTPIVEAIYPDSAMKGFAETFARWGCLFDTLRWGMVHGFPYQQPVPFDAPGPDGPLAPEVIGAEIERRAAVADAAFGARIWRDAVAEWDRTLKPAAIERHRELGDVDLSALDDTRLRAHIDACIEHLRAMAYQHHRFNASAIVPPADFVLQTSAWVGIPPTELFGVFNGYSPASGVVSPELETAMAELRAVPGAIDLLVGDGEPAAVLTQLRARVRGVDEYVRSVGFRLIDGFDLTCRTIAECPHSLLSRLRVALTADVDQARRGADAFAAELRTLVPEEHHATFDHLLAEGRHVYRLRDERGLYSDIPAMGLLRWALLEAACRLVIERRIDDCTHIFLLDVDELHDVLDGRPQPTSGELGQRAARRERLLAQGAPRHLGPPPPEPPSLDQLPPSLARLMAAVGFAIDGILGELDGPAGDDACVVGIPANAGVYEGTVHLVYDTDDLLTFQDGEVLVAVSTGEAFNSMIHLVGAIVTDHGSFASHAAIVARECGFPAVVGCTNATGRLTNGQRVRVDGSSGEVLVLA